MRYFGLGYCDPSPRLELVALAVSPAVKKVKMNHQMLIPAFFASLLVPGFSLGEQALISLPSPRMSGTTSVEALLASRRSVRAYTKESLTLADLGQLLLAAQGVTSSDGKRTAPSAMHRYPLELAVVAQNVDGLANGAYRYWPKSHSLELLISTQPGKQLLARAKSQAQVHSAPAVFVIAAVYERMGPGVKNRTFTDYEAGLASENMLLEAVSLGLGAVITGGIDPVAVKEAVKFAGGEEVIVVIPVGHPVK